MSRREVLRSPGVLVLAATASILVGSGCGSDRAAPSPEVAERVTDIGMELDDAPAVTLGMPTSRDAGWPNEPPGFVTFSDQPWDEQASMGWRHTDRAARSRIVRDESAPFSPEHVLEHAFPRGFPSAGLEPAVDHLILGGVDELFLGLWFRTSDPWQGHASHVNKILYLFNVEPWEILLFAMYGPPGGPYHFRPVAQGHPDVRTGYLPQNVRSISLEPGRWHRLEVHVRAGNSGEGLVRWWQDGWLLGEVTDFAFAPGGFGELQIAPTWGGVGGPEKSQDDYFRFDHIYLSVPGS